MLDWQTTTVLMGVTAAAGWLAWSTWRSLHRETTSGCGNACADCPQGSPTKQDPSVGFVTLDTLVRTAEHSS